MFSDGAGETLASLDGVVSAGTEEDGVVAGVVGSLLDDGVVC